MFKCNKLLGVSLAAVMSISATATNVFAIDTSVIDEKWGKPTVVYGGGLSEDQIQSTRELFDIKVHVNYLILKIQITSTKQVLMPTTYTTI